MRNIATLVLVIAALTLIACGGRHSTSVQDANGQKVLLNETSYGLMSVNSTHASENSRRQAEMGKMAGDRQVELSEEAIVARERRGTWGGPMMGGSGAGPTGCKPKYYGQPMDPGKADRCQEAEVVRDRRNTWGGTPYGYGPYGTFGAPFTYGSGGNRYFTPGQSTYTAPSSF